MITQNEYNIIVNKNNMLMSQVKNLRETLDYKEEEYDKIRKHIALLEKRVREMCEPILAKDRSEMDLSGKKTWSDTKLLDLISKTEKAYKEHEKERTILLNKLMDDNSQRRDEIESLKQQISIMLNSNEVYSSEEELEKAYTEKKAKEQAKAELPDGAKVETVVINEDEDEEYEEEERKIIEQNLKDNSKTVTGTVYVKQSGKKVRDNKEMANRSANTTLFDLNEHTKRFSDLHWKVLRIIGEGHSRLSVIKEHLTEEEANKVRPVLTELNVVCIAQDKCSTPIVKNFTAYSLTLQGKQIYKHKFGKEPVMSEKDRIRAEHTSLEHGYGIYFLANILKEKSKYMNISIYNRKNPVPITEGTGNQSFIPDIKYEEIVGNKAFKNYIEYETGDCTYDDLCSKLTKMFYCTRYIQIIVANKDVLTTYIDKINKYVAEKESVNPGGLKGKFIRLCSASWFADYQPVSKTNSEKWEVEYNFNEGITPTIINKAI